MTTTHHQSFAGTRITIYTPKPFNDVVSQLYSDIGKPEDAKWMGIARNIHSYDKANKESFIEATEKAVGKYGFMVFQELNHGAWIPLFSPSPSATPLQLKRIILGNPLIAITMLTHDVTAGLSVPVELLVQEKEGGGTDLVYQLPSALIAGGRDGEDGELGKAARVLDGKLEALLEWVAS